jgi:hypothetical protein
MKLKAAEALYPLLSLFHEINGSLLDAVTRTTMDGAIDQITLQFGSRFFAISCNGTDDTIDLSIPVEFLDVNSVSHLEPWSELIGKRFGWGWVTINQQGYLDGVLLSFDGITPTLLITAIASSLHIRRIV